MYRRRNRFRIQLLMSIAGVVLIFLLIVYTPVGGLLRAALGFVQAPFYRGGVALSNFFEQVANGGALRAELERSQRMLQVCSSENIRAGFLRSENERLQALLDIEDALDADIAGARILSVRRGELDALIDIGDSSGVKVGMPVVYGESVIIGKVIEVFQTTSRIRWMLHSDAQLAVRLGADSLDKLVSGHQGSGILMELIPENTDVAFGMPVYTSGVEDNIPAGLLLGHVVEVLEEPGAVFKDAIIAPPVNYHSITTVGVIKAYGSTS